tara:strand:+ start:1025 stop:1189 length:165 start_codon:yes stop_codon:yes gene_type:complete
MYKLIKTPETVDHVSTVKRLADNAFIPMSEGNADYQEYLAWLAEGNTPEPADAD